MAAFIRQGDYANGTFIDLDEWLTELDSVYGTFNGESFDKELHHKFDGTEPGIIIDQLDTGMIADFRKSSASSCPIANNGKITNSNVIKRTHNWFFDIDGEDRVFIVPNGVSMRVLRFGGIYRTGLSGSSTVFQLWRIGDGFPLSFNLVFNGSEGVNGLVEVGINGTGTLNPGDIIYVDRIGLAGTAVDFTLFMEWEQRLG